jgi:hypothetical protein
MPTLRSGDLPIVLDLTVDIDGYLSNQVVALCAPRKPLWPILHVLD